MKLKRNWRLGWGVCFIALLLAQLPGIAQAALVFKAPVVWKGYVPIVQNEPTPTPTPTPTIPPTETATFTPTIPPTITPTPAPSATPLPPGTPPPYSSSYYLLTVDGNKHYNLGCKLGTQDRDLPGSREQLIVLDYGSPKQINGEYGTDLFWMGPVTITQIKAAVENFGRGYYVCADTDRTSQLHIIVGTTNYGTLLASSVATARAHGVAWARMINDINAWFKTNQFSAQVNALGGNDIELAWNSATITRAWVDGYVSVSQYDYYDFGTADGCATRADPTRTTCANGWTQEDAWYKAYGTRPGFPLPEIYNTRGANAEQWAILSQYSVRKHGYKIEFFGVLTQWQACGQVDAAQCVGVNNTPSTGWLQLYNELKRDPSTFFTPKYSTDILWAFTMPSGPLAAPAAAAASGAGNAPPMAQQTVERMNRALEQNDLDPQMRSNLQGKLENAQRVLADAAEGRLNPAPKSAELAPQAPAVKDSDFPSGIFDGAAGVIHSWEAVITNHWQGQIGTEYVLASAGAMPDDPFQGVVVVMRVSGDRSGFSRQFYLTPQKVGAVRVVEQIGGELVLESASGQQLQFSPATGQWSALP